MDLLRLLTLDECSFLSGFPPSAITALGTEGATLHLPEAVPISPLVGGYQLSQAFGLRFISELRRKGWGATCAVAAGRWLASQDPLNLNEEIITGKRFCLAQQQADPKARGNDLDEVRLLLDESQVQALLAKMMPSAAKFNLKIGFVDIATGWDNFLDAVDGMDGGDTYYPSLN